MVLPDVVNSSSGLTPASIECTEAPVSNPESTGDVLHAAFATPAVDAIDPIAGISDQQCQQYFKMKLGTLIPKGAEFAACCPFHNDKHPSLSVNPAKQVWYCHACKIGGGLVEFEIKYSTKIHQVPCSTLEAQKTIAKMLGTKPSYTQKEAETIYSYTDVNSQLLYQVVRMPGKKFHQRRPNGSGGWIFNTQGVKKVLYDLPHVTAAASVIVVEGEKDVDNLKAALPQTHKDWAVTTSPGGAGKWLNEFSSYLKGKQVLILPDNDEAGRKHANEVALSIHQNAAGVKIVDLPGLPEKGDVSDFLHTHTAAELFCLAQETPFWKPALSLSNSEGKDSHQMPKIITLSSVTASEVDWLWEPYLPKGMLAMVSGDPGAGKTFVAQGIAADLTLGQTPFKHTPRLPANVLYLSVENSPEHVLRPRFDSLGGDPSRFYLIEGSVRLSDVAYLSLALQQTHAELMVVDPIQLFLGAEVDAHRANQTRPLLDNLARLAKMHKCCIMLLRHLSKEPKGRAIHRGLGSIDFTGAVRTELLVGSSAGNPEQHALVHIKTNLGQIGPTLGYTIDPNGKFSWTGESQLTAKDLLLPEASPEKGEAMAEAKDFLLSALAKGPRVGKELIVEADQAGISIATLKRAKKALKIASDKDGQTGPWMWSLPEGNHTPETQK